MNCHLLKEVKVVLVQQQNNMKFERVFRINNREFGLGIFIKKESIVSKFNHMFYIHIFWFKIGLKIAYGDKFK
jgi:hypothetical protein